MASQYRRCHCRRRLWRPLRSPCLEAGPSPGDPDPPAELPPLPATALPGRHWRPFSGQHRRPVASPAETAEERRGVPRGCGRYRCDQPSGTAQVFGLISEVADRYRSRRKRRPWRSGSSTGRCARCLQGEPCGSKPFPPSGCTGPATNGSKPMIRTPSPSRPAMNTSTSVSFRSSGLRSASRSSGRRQGIGKGGIFRSTSMWEEAEAPIRPDSRDIYTTAPLWPMRASVL